MLTRSGIRFPVFNPEPKHINWIDICSGLQKPRFNMLTMLPWNILSHTVFGVLWILTGKGNCPPEELKVTWKMVRDFFRGPDAGSDIGLASAREFFIHDLGETWYGDIPTPIKKHLQIVGEIRLDPFVGGRPRMGYLPFTSLEDHMTSLLREMLGIPFPSEEVEKQVKWVDASMGWTEANSLLPTPPNDMLRGYQGSHSSVPEILEDVQDYISARGSMLDPFIDPATIFPPGLGFDHTPVSWFWLMLWTFAPEGFEDRSPEVKPLFAEVEQYGEDLIRFPH